MSPRSSCFSFETAFTTSPARTVELLHFGSCRAEDTTYLGRLFNLSAHSPLRDSHRAANHSSLCRPSSMASAPRASSSSSFAHPWRSLSLVWRNQPARPKPSSPVGSWTTPSSETFSLTMILPILFLLGWRCLFPRMDPPPRREGGARQPPPSPLGRCLSTCGVPQGE